MPYPVPPPRNALKASSSVTSSPKKSGSTSLRSRPCARSTQINAVPLSQSTSGEVRFVTAEAEPTTRTFRIEIELPNPTAEIPDGITAEIRLPLGEIKAHRVSPAILTLTDDGTIGVKTLGPDNRVRFRPIQIIGDSIDGVWLIGLPERVILITVGQEFVAEGQIVRPIDEATLTPVSGSES